LKEEKIQKKIIFAHRGSSFFAPENTLSAFRLAKLHKADGFEFDVRLSKDGQVVVTHDLTFRRYKLRKRVRKLTLTEIKKINVGNEHFPNEKVPTLQEVLNLWKNNETPKYMQIEVKTSKLFNRTLENKIIALLKDFNNKHPELNLYKHLFIISFNPFALHEFKKVSPELSRGLLIRKSPRRLKSKIVGFFKALADPDIIILNKKKINERFIAANSDKYLFGTYGINSKAEFQKIKDLDLTFVTVKDPSFCQQEIR